MLQLGPGDFCRLAFQTIKGQTEYDISSMAAIRPPSSTAALDLPGRPAAGNPAFQTDAICRSLDPLRKAFESSTPFGSDYVEGVFHGENPFSLKREPFFSKYTGYLDIPSAGKYGFMTSSQDAVFC